MEHTQLSVELLALDMVTRSTQLSIDLPTYLIYYWTLALDVVTLNTEWRIDLPTYPTEYWSTQLSIYEYTYI